MNDLITTKFSIEREAMITIETLKQCKQSQQFLLLGNKPQLVSILDSSLLWSMNKDIVFHTGYRIVGTQPQIKSTLTDLKFTQDIVDSVINSCITHNNHSNLFNSIYNQELIDYSNYIKALVSQPSNSVLVPQIKPNPVLVPPTKIHLDNINYLQSVPLQETPENKPTARERKVVVPQHKRGITQIPLQNQPTINNTGHYLQLSIPIKRDTLPPPDLNAEDEKFEDITGNVDIFDFEKYQEDFSLLSQYFDGVELYLRTANWIMYKYIRLTTDEERAELHSDLEKQVNKHDWLSGFTSLMDTLQLLWSWFKHFRPHLLDTVISKHEKFSRHMSYVFNKVYRLHVDPNHVDVDLTWWL